MGIILNNNVVWGPKKAISEAFFEDISYIIKDKKDYDILQLEIDKSIFYYTWTLDYRNKSLSDLLLFSSLVDMLIEKFDEIYEDRLNENIIQVYKSSI